MAGGVNVTVHLSTAHAARRLQSGTSGNPHSTSTGLLPFTGLELRLLLVFAIVLLVVGGLFLLLGRSTGRV
ncbi:MAG: hypothetical protein ACYCO3_07565 [Mycobacteriales bacterium]